MDRIERLMRDANPEVEYDARAKAQLAKIFATASPEPLPRTLGRPRALRFLMAVSLVTVLSLLGVFASLPHQASAATPPILKITPTDMTKADALNELASTALAVPDRSDASEIQITSWNLNVSMDDDGQFFDRTIVPLRQVIALGPDGPVEITNFAAQPYDQHGNPVEDHTAPAPGTLLDSRRPPREELLFDHAPPTEAGAYSQFFQERFPEMDPTDASFVVSLLLALHHEQVLSPEQNAAMLGFLQSVEGLELEGTGHDRAGRTAWVLATTPAESGARTWVFLSQEEGTLLSVETIHASQELTGTSSPAVVSYYLFEAIK